jgi:hypothetical protein
VDAEADVLALEVLAGALEHRAAGAQLAECGITASPLTHWPGNQQTGAHESAWHEHGP